MTIYERTSGIGDAAHVRKSAEALSTWLAQDSKSATTLKAAADAAAERMGHVPEGMHAQVASTPHSQARLDVIEAAADALAAQTNMLDGTNMLPSAALDATSDDELALELAEAGAHIAPDRWYTDMPAGNGGLVVADALRHYLADGNPQSMGRFRLGLDIVDIDPVIYALLDASPASIGNWFPALKAACDATGALRVPETQIAKVPPALLQLTRLEWEMLSETDFQMADTWAAKTFDLSHRDFFVKTGVRASKFDFRNAHVSGSECDEMGRYALWLLHEGVNLSGYRFSENGGAMAVYGPATTCEFAVREWIADPEDNPTIYQGLPLRSEFRCFVDLDAGECFGVGPYWDPDTMKSALAAQAEDGNAYALADLATYMTHEPTLVSRHETWAPIVRERAELVTLEMSKSDMHGQWSLDVMLSGDTLYAIDMAPAHESALREFAEHDIAALPTTWNTPAMRTEALLAANRALSNPEPKKSLLRKLLGK